MHYAGWHYPGWSVSPGEHSVMQKPRPKGPEQEFRVIHLGSVVA
jgi:hypothetical protein